MKRLAVLALPVLLTACASQDLSWIDEEGKAEVIIPSGPAAVLLPEGEATPAELLEIPEPPEFQVAQSDLNIQPGEFIDGNGVPVLNVDMPSVEAVQMLKAALAESNIDIVETNTLGTAITVQSPDFLEEGTPSWFNRYDQRLRLSFSDIGAQSRLSVWRIDNTQPADDIRSEVFAIASAILIEQ